MTETKRIDGDDESSAAMTRLGKMILYTEHDSYNFDYHVSVRGEQSLCPRKRYVHRGCE